MEPSSGCSTPAMMFMSVLLPAPFSPHNTTSGRTSKSIPFNTSTPQDFLIAWAKQSLLRGVALTEEFSYYFHRGSWMALSFFADSYAAD